jgi:hypothetical protein
MAVVLLQTDLIQFFQQLLALAEVLVDKMVVPMEDLAVVAEDLLLVEDLETSQQYFLHKETMEVDQQMNLQVVAAVLVELAVIQVQVREYNQVVQVAQELQVE